MISEGYVYQAADRLLTQHGEEALNEVNRLLCEAVDQRDAERALLMIRIRLAILVLQAPQAGPLH